ncbi:DUF6415 family natural product biosynthesis protein [Streptomyces sp. NPDC002514]|uniref:DUF6415 family natural product biosynthesis protein n=1 Tax=Streptomyces sp. NPDC001270 TaxID=3364554 RepID=UPI00369258E5
MTELSCVLRSVPDPAWERWETIRIGRFYGLQALARLGTFGTVAIDPVTPAVYFFVDIGSVASWPEGPASGAFSVTTDFMPPPDDRQMPPGVYWLVPPQQGAVRLTDGLALLAALTEAVTLTRPRQVRKEILLLTRDLPDTVPPRDRLDPLVEELRVYVEDLIRYVMEALMHEEGSYDRRTAQWLLDRVRKALAAEPAPTDREAAERAEDLALSCRALAGIHERQRRHGAGGAHA